LMVKAELGLASEQDGIDLVTDALDRGIIARTTYNGEQGFYLTDAIDGDRDGETSDTQTREAVEDGGVSTTPDPEPEPQPEPKSGPEPEPDDLARPDPSDLPRDELEAEVRELRSGMDVMETRVDALMDRMDTLTKAVFGEDSVPGDPEKSEDLLTKFVDMRGRVDEHDEKLSMVSSESGSRSTPDERAMNLRTALYDEAKQNGEKKAVMSRDQAKFALNGGLSRAQLLDAMRRAADGDCADINGKSDLEPVDGLEFVAGSGRNKQSKIRLDLSEASGENLRTNISDA